MDPKKRLQFLKIMLIVTGIACLSLAPLGVVWPSGWLWGSAMGMAHSHYIYMIWVVYATLGIFLFMASRDPLKHRSLIWFTIWSSLAHGVLMGVQAAVEPAEYGHLVADAPALIIIAAILAVLMPREGAK